MLDAIYWVACLVLVVSGAAKVIEPTPSESTLRSLGVYVPAHTGRALGALEVLLGAAGLLVGEGGWARLVAVLVGAIYMGFALVVWGALRRGLDDCGCLGVRSREPSAGHAVFDAALGAVAMAAAVLGPVDPAKGLSTLEVPVAVLAGLAVAAAAGTVIARI